ncbi:calcium-binding protein, partial [bacterium]|nr:calcium-binding protein [bacterium]
YLTKGENLTIDVSNITSNPDNVSYRISGKDLVVAVNDGVNEKEFTIVNLGTKDVTNNKTKKVADTSSVELKLSDSVTQDLRSEIVAASNAGTYHNDYINRKDDYKLFKDKKKTVIQTDWTKKGLTINGGAGNDTIIDTNYSDTIKAGTGMTEEITGGTGNDKLYASTTANSNTTFVFNAGDGKDTVYSGKGEDTIQINDADLSSFTYEQGTKKNNKDLIIKYTKDDQITIKDYYTVDKKGRITGVNAKNSIKNFVVNGSSVDIGNINNTPTETSEDNKFVCGSSGDDTITVSGNYNVVFAGAGNDEINATGSSGTVYGGEGDDTVNVNANLYTTTTVYGGNGNDTINIGAGNHFVEVFAGTGDNDIVNISAEKQGNTEVHLMKGDGKVTIKGMHSNDNYLDIYTDASCGYVGVKNGTNLEVKLLDNNGNATGDVIIVEEYYLDNGNKNGTVSTNTRVNGSNDFPVNIVKISEGQNGTSQSDYVFGTYSDDTISVGSGYYQHVKTGEGNDVVDLNDANGTTWITFLSGEGNLTIKNASWTQGINLRMDAATADDINFDSFEVRGTDLILKRGEQVLTIEDCLYSSGESVGYLKPNIRIKNNDKPYESGIINLTEYLNSNADFVVYPTDDNKFIIPANSKTATAIFENYEFNNDLTYDNNLTFHKLPDGNLGVYNNNAKVYTLYDSDKNVMVQDSNGDIKTVRYGNSTGYNGGDGDDIIIGTNESYCTIKGNGGNDILIGGQNTEYPTTYHFYKGDGHDILIPQHGSGQVSLQFNDNIKYSDMAYDIEGCGLKILYNKVDNEFQDSVLIENYFSNVSSEQMNNIQISAQTDYACIRNLSDVLAENGLRTSLTTTVEGTENNDLIFGNNNNNVFFGREGSDTIVSNGSWTSIYTNFNPAVENYTNKKDPTAGTVDVVKAYGESNTIYAQSETNYVSSYAANGNDYYNAYLDQKTIIDDKGGNGDSLTITNSYGTIDGRYSIGGNLNTYLFVNVKSYNPENPSECDYDVIVTNNEGKNSLKTGDFANGIYIKNNEIENIWTSDGYKITSAQIATIAQQTAAWLSTNNYDSVSAVIADTEQAGNIDTLVAAIQTNASAMWTAA